MADRLTLRERQCVALAGEGKRNKEIARALGIGERTAANHLQRAYAKLNVSTREDAVRMLNSTYSGQEMSIPENAEPGLAAGVTGLSLEQPPTRYRPPPEGLAATSAIIGVFALIGGLVVLGAVIWVSFHLL